MKKLFAVILALALVLSLAACGQKETPASSTPAPSTTETPATAEPAADPLTGTIDFCIGNPGGTAEIIGGALIELLKADMPNMEISSIQSAGTGASAMMLAQGSCDLAMITAESVYTATVGEAPFTEASDNMRAVCSFYPNTLQIWANKSANVKELADIADKRICFGVTSSSQYYPFLRIMEKLYDLTPEKIEANGGSVSSVAWGDTVDMLSDNNLDVVIWETSFPASAIVNAQAGGKEFDFVQMDPAKMEEFMKMYPGWTTVTVPAGTYAGQKEDVTCLGTCMTYYVSKDLPNEVVYQITKTICENLDTLSNTHALMKTVSLDTIGLNLGGEIHPGAQQYYEENNIKYGM